MAIDVSILTAPGYRVDKDSDGTLRVVRSNERLTHTVAFRLTPSEYLNVQPFFEAFPGRGSEAFRWLLSNPEVAEVIRKKVAEATRLPGAAT